MLFDLQTGRRKTVVKVVYSILALLMGGSLVLFGIGSDAPGGILDALGLGGDDTSSNPQYEQQLEDAEAKLETDPENAQAVLDLVRYHFLTATGGITTDQTTGQVSISEDAHTELEATVTAWKRYLALKLPTPDVGAATNAAQAYVYLQDPTGASEAQAIVADEQKTASAYGLLAQYLYVDFQFKEGDAAAKKAVAASDASAQENIRKGLEQFAESQRKRQKQIEKAAEEGGPEAGGTQLDDPFGALEGGSTPPPPAPPAGG